jgi:hypothetical protein
VEEEASHEGTQKAQCPPPPMLYTEDEEGEGQLPSHELDVPMFVSILTSKADRKEAYDRTLVDGLGSARRDALSCISLFG